MSPITHLYLFHFHVFFAILGIFGIVLLYHWCKTLPPEKQVIKALACIFVGAIGVLLTVPYCLVGLKLMGM